MDSKSPNKCFLAWTEKFLSSKGQAGTFQPTFNLGCLAYDLYEKKIRFSS